MFHEENEKERDIVSAVCAMECVTSSIFGVQLAGNKVKMKFS